MVKTIEIPEGYEARIEGNKVILEPREIDDERMIKAILSAIRGGLDTEKFLEKHGTNYEEVEAYLEKQKEPHYSPLCNTIKDKIREYIANHFIADRVVKTDMKSIVKAMEEGVRLGKEDHQPTEWSKGYNARKEE